MRIVQPSASGVDRLLQCGWSFNRAIPGDAGPSANAETGEALDAAEFGTETHEVFAFHLTGDRIHLSRPLKKYPPAVLARARQAADETKAYLAKHFPGGCMIVERSFALNTKTGAVRATTLRKSDHHYPLKRHEVGLTCDLAVAAPGKLLVLDLKTGRKVGAPRTSGQLLTIAYALTNYFAMPLSVAVTVGFVHAPEDMPVTIYDDEVEHADLAAFAKRLRTAHKTIGTGTLRPGDECDYCPARLICPTTSTALVQLKAPQGQLMTPERVGAIHSALAEYNRLAEALKPQLKAYVEQNGPCTRPDGKVLALVERPFTNFSMATIRRALGEQKAAKEIERLDKLKCIERGVREELRAENDR